MKKRMRPIDTLLLLQELCTVKLSINPPKFTNVQVVVVLATAPRSQYQPGVVRLGTFYICREYAAEGRSSTTT